MKKRRSIFQSSKSGEKGFQNFIIVDGKRKDHCFLAEHITTNMHHRMCCGLNRKRNCRFGLTQLRVPLKCPLRKGKQRIIHTLELKAQKLPE